VEGTVREVKRRVRVVASSYRAIDRSVTRWIMVTMVEWSSELRWELVPKTGCSNLIHDFTAVTFSVTFWTSSVKMPISWKSVILALLLSFLKVFRVLSFNSFYADFAVC